MVASFLCGLYIDYSLMLVQYRVTLLYICTMLSGLCHYRILSNNNITTLDSGVFSGLGSLRAL